MELNIELLETATDNKAPVKFKKMFPLAPKNLAMTPEFFRGIVGIFVRQISDYEELFSFDPSEEDTFTETITGRILDSVDFEGDTELPFINFINSFISQQQKSNLILHPYFFNYIFSHEIKVRSSEQKNIATFLFKIFAEGDQYKSIFDKKHNNNLLIELIISSFPELQKKTIHNDEYEIYLPFIRNLFKNDFEFLSQHTEYFSNNFELFLRYYYNFYLTQLSLKLSLMADADWSQPEPIYYGLDWEPISRTRSTVNSYRKINETSKSIYVHYKTLEMLNVTTNLGDRKRIFTLPEIKQQLKMHDEAKYLNSLKKYIESKGTSELNSNQLTDLYGEIFQIVKKKLNPDVVDKYRGRVLGSSEPTFVKSRGPLGKVLNISQDFLLLLVAVSVKDQKITLKQLFHEFELRGVTLDRQSKHGVIELLESLNIIEKKSDSGDAQYVKPIL